MRLGFLRNAQKAIKRGLFYPKKRFLHIKSDYSVLFPCRKRHIMAFTLGELLLVLAIIGTISSIAIPLYTNQIDKARIAKAISDIYIISLEIEDYWVDNAEFPESLADVGRNYARDPWGRYYEYLKIDETKKGKDKDKGKGEGEDEGEDKGKKEKARKDRFMVPLNTDFDLYSKGKDGDSKPPLTANASRDDIVRANNGTFIGLAVDY